LDLTIPADELPPPRRPPQREEKAVSSSPLLPSPRATAIGGGSISGIAAKKKLVNHEPDERRAFGSNQVCTFGWMHVYVSACLCTFYGVTLCMCMCVTNSH
jgi:hypothetical protein